MLVEGGKNFQEKFAKLIDPLTARIVVGASILSLGP
jgi:hypothetical protein